MSGEKKPDDTFSIDTEGDFDFTDIPAPRQDDDGDTMAGFGFDALPPGEEDGSHFDSFQDPSAGGFDNGIDEDDRPIGASDSMPPAQPGPFDGIDTHAHAPFPQGEDELHALEDEEDELEEAAPAKGSNVAKYAVYGVGAVCLAGIVAIGSTVILPMMGLTGGGDGGEVVASTPMPAFDPTVAVLPPPVQTAPTLPATVTPPPSLPPAANVDGFDAPVPQFPEDVADISDDPGPLPDGSEDPFSSATVIPPVQTEQQAALLEPSAGPVPIAPPVPALPSPGLEAENALLVERIAALEERLTRMEARGGVEAPTPSAMPPAKPEIVDGWTLQGAEGDVAWVQGPDGFEEIEVGAVLAGVGVVENITRYEDDWVVVTSNGIITQ